jgi:uncharacterized protein (TIGR02145 family)
VKVHPKYQWAYDSNEVATYGRLYTWYVVTDSRNVCPSGWHVPADKEWTTLITHLGGNDVAGGELKETGTAHWFPPNEGASNETGFTALPGGTRQSTYDGDSFVGIRTLGEWWSSTEDDTHYAYGWYMVSHLSGVYSSVYMSNSSKQQGFSVRCLKN